MISFLLFIGLILVIAIFLAARRLYGPVEGVLSPLFYFTCLWFVSFPLRALLIDRDLVRVQVSGGWSREQLAAALILATIYLTAICAGALTYKDRYHPESNGDHGFWPSAAPAVTTLFAAIAAIIFYFDFVVEGSGIRYYSGSSLIEARLGKGPYFLFSEAFSPCAIAYAATWIKRRNPRVTGIDIAVLLALAVAAVLIGTGLHTRRTIAILVFTVAMVFFLRHRRAQALAIAVLLASFLAMPTLQILRDACWSCALNITTIQVEGSISASSEAPANARAMGARLDLTAFSSSFEGAGHLATFLKTATWSQILWGVDHGEAWLHNSGLNLIPRAIWHEKPVISGSLAEQAFLYPNTIVDMMPSVALPPSFAVDFIFGFGVFFGLVLCFLMGRLLHVLCTDLWSRDSSPAGCAFALYVFIYMFNVVRGGTAMISGLLLMTLVLILFFGPRATLMAAISLIVRTFQPTLSYPTFKKFARNGNQE